jgi:FkbM family methyltransferase
MILNYGMYDDPMGLFREIYVDRLYSVKPTPGPGILLDIGANIGAVTQYYLRLYPGLKAHAYEPNPDAFKMLGMNMEGSNAPVQIFPEAIGRQRGTLSLWVDVTTTYSTAYSKSNPVPGGTGGHIIEVPTINLDEAWERAGRPPIWLLKIDTEGAEGDILEGASQSCLTHVQNVVVEYHDNIVPGVSQRCERVLAKAGFCWSTREHPWNEGILYCTRFVRTTTSRSPCDSMTSHRSRGVGCRG